MRRFVVNRFVVTTECAYDYIELIARAQQNISPCFQWQSGSCFIHAIMLKAEFQYLACVADVCFHVNKSHTNVKLLGTAGKFEIRRQTNFVLWWCPSKFLHGTSPKFFVIFCGFSASHWARPGSVPIVLCFKSSSKSGSLEARCRGNCHGHI